MSADKKKPHWAARAGFALLCAGAVGGIALLPSPADLAEPRMMMRIGPQSEDIIRSDADLYAKAVEDFASLQDGEAHKIRARFDLEPADWLERSKAHLVARISAWMEGTNPEDRDRYLRLRRLNSVAKWTVSKEGQDEREALSQDSPSVLALDCFASAHGIVAVVPMFAGYYSSDEDHPNYHPLGDAKHPQAGDHTGYISPPQIWLDTQSIDALAPLTQVCTSTR